MTTNRTTENLSWTSLKERFPIGTVTVDKKEIKFNKLKDACDDGTIKGYIQECADEVYGGDFLRALMVFKKNLSSVYVNIKKRPGSATQQQDKARCELLREHCDALEAEAKQTRAIPCKAYWQWTMDEIKSIADDDVSTLASVYNNMASKRAKYPELVVTIEDFDERFKFVSAKKSAAEKAKKLAASKPEIDQKLLAKVLKASDGGKVTINKEEGEMLKKLLESIGK